MPFFKGLLQSSKLSLQSVTGIIRVVTNASCLALFTRSSPSRFRSLALQNSRMTRSPDLHILWRNAKYFVEVSRALKKKSLGPLLGLMFSVLGIQKGSPRLLEITLIPSRGENEPHSWPSPKTCRQFPYLPPGSSEDHEPNSYRLLLKFQPTELCSLILQAALWFFLAEWMWPRFAGDYLLQPCLQCSEPWLAFRIANVRLEKDKFLLQKRTGLYLVLQKGKCKCLAKMCTVSWIEEVLQVNEK